LIHFPHPTLRFFLTLLLPGRSPQQYPLLLGGIGKKFKSQMVDTAKCFPPTGKTY